MQFAMLKLRTILSLVSLSVVECRHKKVAAPPPPPDFYMETLEKTAMVMTIVLLTLYLGRQLMKVSVEASGPAQQCSLLFCSTDKCMSTVWHMSDAPATTRASETVLAWMTPTTPVAAYKLQHNRGRTEIVRGVSQNKVFYHGWVQYLTLVHKHGDTTVHFEADVPGRAVLLAAVNIDSVVLRCRPGASLDLSDAQGIAVVPGPSMDFDMTHFDVEQFELLGNRLGAAESFADGRSPGTRSFKSPSTSLRRASTRSDMPVVQVTYSTDQAMA